MLDPKLLRSQLDVVASRLQCRHVELDTAKLQAFEESRRTCNPKLNNYKLSVMRVLKKLAKPKNQAKMLRRLWRACSKSTNV